MGPRRRLWLILAQYDTEPLELVLALATAVRGVWFMATATAEIPGLVYLREAWGFSFAATILGTTWLLALAFALPPRWRAFCALGSATLRTYLTAALLLVDATAVNVPYNGSLAVVSTWLYVRLRAPRPR